MRLVLLGTGTPNAEPDRSGPSAAVIAGGIPYIVDCGPGTVRRAGAANEGGVTELALANLENLFITHLHSDHTAGLADMILTPWVLERERPLRVWGPAGTKHMVGHVLEAYSSDIAERINGLEPANTTGCAAETTESNPGLILEENGLRVEAFKVNHGALLSFGYRFTHEGKSIVISGDTAPFPGMVEAYRGCDILLHEVYSEKGLKSRSKDWQKYHRAVHTSASELVKIACTVKPGLLVLYHQLLHGADEKTLLEEIRSIYTGEVVYGRDLDVFTL
jgi:ribonuclease BN (tRNA processing enzyme)